MGYTINDVKNGKYYFDLETERIEPMEELLKKWNSLSEEKRLNVFTTKLKKPKIDGNAILEDIFFEIAKSDCGYEGMEADLAMDATKDFRKRFQKILNEIREFPSAKFYYEPRKPINPYVDLEEETDA